MPWQAQEAVAEEEEEAEADGGTPSSAAGAAEAAATPAEEPAAGVANGDVNMADAPASQVGFCPSASPAHRCQCCKGHGLGMTRAGAGARPSSWWRMLATGWSAAWH